MDDAPDFSICITHPRPYACCFALRPRPFPSHFAAPARLHYACSIPAQTLKGAGSIESLSQRWDPIWILDLILTHITVSFLGFQ